MGIWVSSRVLALPPVPAGSIGQGAHLTRQPNSRLAHTINLTISGGKFLRA